MLQNKVFLYSVLLLLTTLAFSCNKEEEVSCDNGILDGEEIAIDCGGCNCPACPMTYPEEGINGTNLLYCSGEDTIFAEVNSGLSLHASVPEGSTLKLKISQIGIGLWGYDLAAVNGWNIAPFNQNENTQVLTAVNHGIVEARFLSFSGDFGGFRIDFYENGDEVTKSQIYKWK